MVMHAITSLTDRMMSSTLVQGVKVTTHNTSHPAEPQHLECEDCDKVKRARSSFDTPNGLGTTTASRSL